VVKHFVLLLFSINILFANEIDKTIKSLVDDDIYAKNRSFISILFENEKEFYKNSSVDVVKVAEKLKENGLLKIFFDTPSTLHVKFYTNGNSLFFVKLISDTLRSMGYYRFITSSSKLNNSTFEWSITLKSEYAIDPTMFSKELAKRGSYIKDIDRINDYKWEYSIDVANAYLNVKKLQHKQKAELKRALNESWLNISDIKKLSILSKAGNRWYPNISIYDKALRLLKVYKHNKKTSKINIKFPRDAVYVKISDLYSIKNIKNGLIAYAYGQR
jgi:hypothetical protein